MDDFYDAGQQQAIDTAGVRCVETMRKLREYDQQPPFPIDAWPTGAARAPEYPPTEGAQ